jgi:uncharacterized protein YbjT (DUF2867 family)
MKEKGKTALVFGSTGLTGNALTHLLIEDENYSLIKLFVRKPSSIKNPNVKEIIIGNDFSETDISEELRGDELFCCVGTTMKKAGSKEAFEEVDLNIPVRLSKIAVKNQVGKFLIISSIGANPRSRNFYLRTKGKMEEQVLISGIKKIHIFRPSLILGNRNENRFGENIGKILYKVFSFVFIGSLKKYKGIEAKAIARAMINVAKGDYKNNIFESDEMATISKI